ncbi:Uncharacterised protein [Bordetella pertussis]|nr:Uncharacterised protein [Bordetella pertussis]CFP64430.1 Uncharacterised protein [Bordetella pertussis]
MPMLVLPPGLFSMTTGCLSSRPMVSATVLAMVSIRPPGGAGTT